RGVTPMKKLIVLLSLAAMPLLLLPDSSEAFGRRRCRAYRVEWQVVWPAAVEPVEHFVSPKGRVYRISFSPEPAYEFERRAVISLDAAPPGPDDYIGTDRGKAKTSIADGDPKSYSALGDLLDDVVANSPDDFVRHQHDPP